VRNCQPLPPLIRHAIGVPPSPWGKAISASLSIRPFGQGSDGFSQGRHGPESLVMAVSGGAYFDEQGSRGQVLVIPLVREVQFPAQSGAFLLQNRL